MERININIIRQMVKDEKIRWTNGKDLVKYSVATFSFMLFFGIFFYLIDLAVALIRSAA